MFVMQEKLLAPDFRKIDWLNGPPLAMADLRGRVVLVDFWDYTCVNCLHTLPYLREWHRRYAPHGLTIAGLHAPEFPFSKSPDLVRKAIGQLEIPYPVGLDNEFATWNAYANRAWPAKYLIDQDGYLRAYHFGEGSYGEFEILIQTLLAEKEPTLRFPEPMSPVRPMDVPGTLCYRPTPELYLGYRRGELGNREGNPPDQTVDYPAPPAQQFLDTVYLEGHWANRQEYIESAGDQPARIHLNYRAAQVNLVMHPGRNANVSVRLLLDGQPVPPADCGDDVQRSGQNSSMVEVTEPRMYRLIHHAGFESHRLTLEVAQAGLQAYAFTFVSCVAEESAIA